MAVMLLGIGLCSGYPCMTTGLRYGVWADTCPTSALRLRARVDATDLVRDRWRSVTVGADALWMEDSRAYGPLRQSYPLSRSLDLSWSLLDPAGAVVPGVETRNLSWSGGEGRLEVKVPDVADGDYRLRANVDAGFEAVDVDVELPLYRPALVHVMSDRPLYKPGQEVLLRSAVLRRRDSKPIAERPGTWRITDPSGIEMMVEKLPTDGFGVSATTFPLDGEAQVGTWHAQYRTGSDSDTIAFEVKPFELPRFTVELASDRPWYAADEPVKITGTARYTSGAPVRNASVELQLGVTEGRWPLPLSWEAPYTRQTKADGTFELELGQVPADLVDLARIAVRARVTDEARETVGGGTQLTLSEHSLALSAVTELADGLVEKFNNRAYVRVTTPDGRPLRQTTLRLSNPYDTLAPVMEAQTDEDGVAAIQVDPGSPVTIVVPPAPVRPRPLRPDAPALVTAQGLPGNRSLDLAERRAFDRVHGAIAACGTLTVGSSNVDVGLIVRPDGSVQELIHSDTPLGRCVGAATRGVRLPSGARRTYRLSWSVPDSLQPHLELSTSLAFGSQGPIDEVLRQRAFAARRCFTRGQGEDANLLDVQWVQRAGSNRVATDITSLGSAGLSPGVRSCVAAAFGNVTLDEPAENDGLGVTRARLSVPVPRGQSKPSASTFTGFQFAVEAGEGATRAEGKLTLGVGSIPHLRLRATPTLAKPGQAIEVEVLRGPNFRGELPKELILTRAGLEVAKGKLDAKTRRATLTVPADVHGFLEIELLGARTVLYVVPNDALSVALSTDNDVYRPGETATLTVQTRAGTAGVPATVSLAGVDQTLSQLATLLAPDDWGRITVRAEGQEAFGQFGPRALQLGQIRGENAARATVLLVGQLPRDEAEDPGVYASASVDPPELEVLTSNFYRALELLIGKVRAWEKTAPKSELITPERTSAWWTEVLKTADPPIVDAFGMPLTLRTLPVDLREQTAPHQLVSDSTRLSEDLENWAAWIEASAP